MKLSFTAFTGIAVARPDILVQGAEDHFDAKHLRDGLTSSTIKKRQKLNEKKMKPKQVSDDWLFL
jgi:hypothetical protein